MIRREEVGPDRNWEGIRLDHDQDVIGDLVELGAVAELQGRPMVVDLAVRGEDQAVAVGDEVLLVADRLVAVLRAGCGVEEEEGDRQLVRPRADAEGHHRRPLQAVWTRIVLKAPGESATHTSVIAADQVVPEPDRRHWGKQARVQDPVKRVRVVGVANGVQALGAVVDEG